MRKQVSEKCSEPKSGSLHNCFIYGCDPSENRNIGKFEFEESRELKTWVDAAFYVDSALDEIDLPEEGDLWIFENPYT